MRRYELQEVLDHRLVQVEAKCDRCGINEEDSNFGRLIPVAVEVDPGEEGGHRDVYDYCDPCLVEIADVLVAAGSRAPLVTGEDLESGDREG